MADTLVKLGRLDEARNEFTLALGDAEGDAALWARYAVMLASSGEQDAAADAAGKALGLDASSVEVNLAILEMHQRNGDSAAADKTKSQLRTLALDDSRVEAAIG
ncbi:MAG: hypothetical protein O3B74_11080 [Proteobacteria bacterium]|nr:hypothetical protein [Pseudomonadota bacterium]MDA1310850.1 hypothetical protein [Pseudomonadota bacterium]